MLWWCWWSCRSCWVAPGSDVVVEVLRATPRLAVLRRGRGGRDPLGVLRLALPLPRGRPLRLGGLGLDLGLGLLLVRPGHHDHVPAVLLGVRLDEAEVGHVLRQPLQQPETELGPVLLTTTEHDRDLHL